MKLAMKVKESWPSFRGFKTQHNITQAWLHFRDVRGKSHGLIQGFEHEARRQANDIATKVRCRLTRMWDCARATVSHSRDSSTKDEEVVIFRLSSKIHVNCSPP
jgi:hypothetical protein